MKSPLQLSVLDQSPVREGGTATDALHETIALAVATEALGYQRFWVAEHHNLGNFAGTSPEILIGQIAARTRSDPGGQWGGDADPLQRPESGGEFSPSAVLVSRAHRFGHRPCSRQ